MCRIVGCLISQRHMGWGEREGSNIYQALVIPKQSKSVNVLSQILSQADSSHPSTCVWPMEPVSVLARLCIPKDAPLLWTPASPALSVLSHAEASRLVFLWGWWQQQQHFLPPSFEHPELQTLPVCETGRLEVCKLHRLGKQLYSHPKLSPLVGQKLNYWFIGARSLHLSVLTSNLEHPTSLHFGVHTACLTRCCWIKRQPPLKLLLKPLKVTAVLPKTSPHCPAAWLHFWPGAQQDLSQSSTNSKTLLWGLTLFISLTTSLIFYHFRMSFSN